MSAFVLTTQIPEGESYGNIIHSNVLASSNRIEIPEDAAIPRKPGDFMSGWEALPRILLKLTVAFVLGFPIGWERGNPARPGLRTYPLLAMGACAYIEIGQFAFANNIDAQARVFQGLVSGIGFIGAGAIIKGRFEVHGLATAVSLWVTVAVGIAVSYQLFALAIVLSGVTLLVLWLLHPRNHNLQGADKVDRDESS